MKYFRASLILLLINFLSQPVLAAEPVPGGACSTQYQLAQTGGPETTGVRNWMMCNGSTWQQRLTFTSAGNVGINDVSPAARLQVDTTAGGIDALILRDLSFGNARFYFSSPLGIGPDLNISSDRLFLRGILYANGFQGLDNTNMISAAGGVVTLGKAGTINLQADNANTIVFQGGYNKDTIIRPYSSSYNVEIAPSGGNVGIGTAFPRATLDINGYTRLAKQSAQPAACSATNDGAIALTSQYTLCACKSGATSWVLAADGATACSW